MPVKLHWMDHTEQFSSFYEVYKASSVRFISFALYAPFAIALTRSAVYL